MDSTIAAILIILFIKYYTVTVLVQVDRKNPSDRLGERDLPEPGTFDELLALIESVELI